MRIGRTEHRAAEPFLPEALAAFANICLQAVPKSQTTFPTWNLRSLRSLPSQHPTSSAPGRLSSETPGTGGAACSAGIRRKRLRLQERGIGRTQRPGAISPHNGHHSRRQTHKARAPLLFRPRRHRAPLSFPQTLAAGRSPLMAHSEAARKPRSFPLPWWTESAEHRPGRAAHFRPEAHKARCSPREPPKPPSSICCVFSLVLVTACEFRHLQKASAKKASP